MRRLLRALFSAVLVFFGVGGSASAQEPPPLPRSMAALGDSITQAANVCCWYGNHPANSWSTGASGLDGVRSHYERLLALKPAISGRNHNDAVPGARMSRLPTQAGRAVSQGAQYVTVLMGANDLCTSSPGAMTSVATFRAQFQQALATLDAGLAPRSRIFVSSIPNIHQLWEIYHASPAAQFVWDVAGICPALLSSSRTAAERQAVKDRNVAFNKVLRQECERYARCQFDGNAVFSFQFSRRHVSTLDFFHPSLSGQAALANVTWNASYWG